MSYQLLHCVVAYVALFSVWFFLVTPVVVVLIVVPTARTALWAWMLNVFYVRRVGRVVWGGGGNPCACHCFHHRVFGIVGGGAPMLAIVRIRWHFAFMVLRGGDLWTCPFFRVLFPLRCVLGERRLGLPSNEWRIMASKAATAKRLWHPYRNGRVVAVHKFLATFLCSLLIP